MCQQEIARDFSSNRKFQQRKQDFLSCEKLKITLEKKGFIDMQCSAEAEVIDSRRITCKPKQLGDEAT